jgi:tRNA(Ile2) C34 agmatinyltransferase TiaS
MVLTNREIPIFTSRKVQIERLNVCNLCEHYVKERKLCELCGCHMPLKVKIKQLNCPKGKW